ncbi:hypothetical protein A3C87_03215 [Candidatus Kaiserbacteria bacterium RIFCSPHIGHO2_02_FULL_49_34]|uniref:Uncharacterized protein n=1 Tax=Candidatus Kaiserbacteria bacterium RIFCSPHIGHO2_02_FULL_49_34 TaxID=1798491 RepID=A0A1F6DIA3_9BACT|nr:MAG: hypothetical protein A3C87_03215 [Candidatus Kaiserbacteria bacterium RIFCSPHIGHO2_02_FULL_49_34]
MRTINIKICGYDLDDESVRDIFLVRELSKLYHVTFSNKPDYVFFHEGTTEYLNYPDAIRIFYTGENIHPNFNLCDYAISFDHLTFEDRHFRLPVFQTAVFYRKCDVENAGDLDFKTPRPFTKEDLAKKEGFCSFVYNNYLADNARGEFFAKLSAYKQVDSGGNYLNTTGTELVSKLDFDRKRKFAIAFENSSRSGYTTEKILTAFAANALPIYYGDPRITEVFNPERYINCADYPDFDAVVARVKEIDENDELYLEIMNKPVLMPGVDLAKDREDFAVFLKQIIDQPLTTARRRKINPVRAITYEQNERLIARYRNTTLRTKQTIAYLYAPLKKISFFEKVKIFLFKKLYAKS